MKRISLIIIFVLSIFTTINAQTDEILSFKNFKAVSTEEENTNYNFMKKEWADDASTDSPSALLRISFENLTIDEIRNLQYRVSPGMVINKQAFRHQQDKENRYYIWVTPNQNGYIQAIITGQGQSNRLELNNLKSKGTYEVTLASSKSIPIRVNVTTLNEDFSVLLDDHMVDASQDIPGIKYGSHKLEILKNGVSAYTTNINVSEKEHTFNFDLRKSKHIRISSRPKGAMISIDGKRIAQAPLEYDFKYGNYRIEAYINEEQRDDITITVDEYTDNEIVLEPEKRKTLTLLATQNGNGVEAQLEVNGIVEENKAFTFTKTFPVGSTQNIIMRYNNFHSKRSIKIKDDMDPKVEFKMEGYHSHTMPWNRDYYGAPFGLSFAYVQKQYVTKSGSEVVLKENPVWESGENAWLSGGQFGLHFQPCFKFGLGLYTGLFYEFYYSKDSNEDEEYQEHNIYAPAHLLFRLPLGEKACFFIHGGAGANYIIEAKLGDTSVTEALGTDGIFKRFNWQLEGGLGFRFRAIAIHAQYSFGMTDHEMYEGDYVTKMNKLTGTFSLVF